MKLFLSRKADLICGCYKKSKKFDELIQILVKLLKSTDGTPEEKVKRKNFALYSFELLGEDMLT